MTEPSASGGSSGEREVEPVASECEWAEFDNELNRALVIFGQNHYPWTKCQQVRSLFQNGSLWATLQDGSRRAVVSHVRRGLEAAMRDKNAQNKPCRWNSRDSHQHLVSLGSFCFSRLETLESHVNKLAHFHNPSDSPMPTTSS